MEMIKPVKKYLYCNKLHEH